MNSGQQSIRNLCSRAARPRRAANGTLMNQHRQRIDDLALTGRYRFPREKDLRGDPTRQLIESILDIKDDPVDSESQVTIGSQHYRFRKEHLKRYTLLIQNCQQSCKIRKLTYECSQASP